MKIIRLLRSILTVAFVLIISQDLFSQNNPQINAQNPIMGFSASRTAAHRSIETRFDAILKSENLRNWMKILSARPHHVGSVYGKENAEFIAAKFREWGYETEIEVFYVLFPTPKIRLLELIEPVKYKAILEEPALKEDGTSDQKNEQLPVYNAYSADGDVTAEVVYVNQGIPGDYEELERRGIDVRGKIVIARYGGSWRGIKVKVAQEHGAIGCILYSDPVDDGYYQGDVYPKGAYKNDRGAQRGSVEDMPLYPGDPLTPGVGAVENAERLSREDAKNLVKIPVLPISYSDAKPILEALDGPVAPRNWRGALPITYHIGPGPSKVHLKLEFNWDLAPAYDVIATIKGSERPDEWIMRGNHHDAWVNGASDPISGLVALMEEARAIGQLVRSGWRPKRTIMYAAWDAEEPGLLGSTEWVEQHADELKDKMAVYINTDGSGRGYLNAGGSHTLEKFFNQIAQEVIDPQKGISVAKRKQASNIMGGSADAEKSSYFKLSALGSGSDYTPFIQHLGIASMSIGYGGENGGGSYHSIYDSFDHYTRFGDPKFEYGIALAKTAGRVTMRLADADIFPMDFTAFTSTVIGYVAEIEKLIADMRKETEKLNRLIKDGIYEAVNDPLNPLMIPKPKAPVPYIDLSPVKNSLDNLKRISLILEETMYDAMGKLSAMTISKIIEIDKALFTSERQLTRDEGLPRRPWFKHHIYAPGFYTGYGVKTLPGIREAIEQRDWNETKEQVAKTAEVIDSFAEHLAEIIKMLDG